MASFVLVHGNWHGGWCWKKLVPLLKTAGHEVFTPTLTGLGERSHMVNRDINLDTHINDVVNLMQFEDLKDVILVGHSYAGMVIAGAADVSSSRIRHLVYLDAVTPGDDQSCYDCLPQVVGKLRRIADTIGDGWLIIYQPELGTFGVSDPDDQKWLVERLRPQPLATNLQKVRFRNQFAMALPKSFIWCSGRDQSGRTKIREDWPCLPASFPTGWGFYEIRTGHDAMVTAPGELAKTLVDIADGP